MVQCPETVGPPCPRCYNNTMDDYAPGMSLNMSEAMRAAMQEKLQVQSKNRYYTVVNL